MLSREKGKSYSGLGKFGCSLPDYRGELISSVTIVIVLVASAGITIRVTGAIRVIITIQAKRITSPLYQILYLKI